MMKKIILSVVVVLVSLSATMAQNDTTLADCFDGVKARVLLPKETFTSGEKIEAEIILLNTTCKGKAQAKVAGWKPLDLENGVAKYTTIAFGEGTKTIEGYVDYYIGDKYKRIGFEKKYTTIKNSESAIIQAPRMNVLYTGIENPLFISVPGVPQEMVNVSMTNATLKKTGKNSYIATAGKRGKAVINVSIKTEVGSVKKMGSMEFRVRDAPVLSAQVSTVLNGDSYETEELKKLIKNSPRLFIGFGEGFPYEKMKFTVGSFRFTIHKAKGESPQPIEAQGQVLTSEMMALIEKIETGDKIIIDNIKAAAPDEAWKTLPIVINVK